LCRALTPAGGETSRQSCAWAGGGANKAQTPAAFSARLQAQRDQNLVGRAQCVDEHRRGLFRDLSQSVAPRVFTSVPELVAAIDEYIAIHNLNPKPFIRTKTAADILEQIIRANSRLSSKQNAHYTRMINIGS
jgi:hypothetical protein